MTSQPPGISGATPSGPPDPPHPAGQTRPARSRIRGPVTVGFAVGFAAAFVVTALALMTPVAEAVHPVLVPASPILRPFAHPMADWPGLATMLVAGVLNGLIYAAVFGLLATVVRHGRSGAARA